MAIFHFNDIVSFSCAFHCSSDEKGVSDKRSKSKPPDVFRWREVGGGGGGWMTGHKTKWYVYV